MKLVSHLMGLFAMSTLAACATENANARPDPRAPVSKPELAETKADSNSAGGTSGARNAPSAKDLEVTYPQDTQWVPVVPPDKEGRGVYVSTMYGELQKKGPTSFLMKFDAGRPSITHSHTNDYWAVVVQGHYRHYLKSEQEYKVFTPGTTWHQKGGVLHEDSCAGPEACVIQIFYPEGWDVTLPSKRT